MWLLTAVCASAAPPPPPPPADVQVQTTYGVRLSCIQADPNDLDGQVDRIAFMFILTNWSISDGYALRLALAEGHCGQVDGAPTIHAARIDANGRPFGPTASRPTGNLPFPNDWEAAEHTATRARFAAGGAGNPIDHLAVFGFSGGTLSVFKGLADPRFGPPTTQSEALATLQQMIPGSTVDHGTSPPTVYTPDVETLDNSFTTRDGFVFVVDDLDAGECVSLNWHLVDGDGNAVGIVDAGGAALGDPYGFGVINIARFADGPGTQTAPDPIYDENGGFDPPDTSNADADNPLYWAEDQSVTTGVDAYPVNPIPAGLPGEGLAFAVEYGAAVTAAFRNPADGELQYNFGTVQSGANLTFSGGDDCPDLSGDGLVGLEDLAIVLANFGAAGVGREQGDLDGDGDVDLSDLAVMLAAFGTAC